MSLARLVLVVVTVADRGASTMASQGRLAGMARGGDGRQVGVGWVGSGCRDEDGVGGMRASSTGIWSRRGRMAVAERVLSRVAARGRG